MNPTPWTVNLICTQDRAVCTDCHGQARTSERSCSSTVCQSSMRSSPSSCSSLVNEKPSHPPFSVTKRVTLVGSRVIRQEAHAQFAMNTAACSTLALFVQTRARSWQRQGVSRHTHTPPCTKCAPYAPYADAKQARAGCEQKLSATDEKHITDSNLRSSCAYRLAVALHRVWTSR